MSLFFFFFFEGALSNEREEVKKARESVFFTFSRLVCDDTASEKNKQTCRSFSITPSLSFPLFDPASDAREPLRAASERAKEKKRKRTLLDKSPRRGKTMAEKKTFDTRELGEALSAAGAATAGPSSTSTPTSTPPPPPKPLTINDLPKEMLVSIFMALKDLRWVRHTIPLVCKAWNELYCSKDASPLHAELEVDFYEEIERTKAAAREREGEKKEWAFGGALVHGSRVISWAERRSGSVRRLHLKGPILFGGPRDFSPKNLGELVAAVAGPSLTEISIGSHLQGLCKEPFWEALRDVVVPAGRLRSLAVTFEAPASESVVEALGQLAGSLEELDLGVHGFPESLCALTNLRRLSLTGHRKITAIPAEISSLKKLKQLDLYGCGLSSLPKELGELSGLTSLDLRDSLDVGDTPEDELFPAALGKLQSLRYLGLRYCGLLTVPAFVAELKSLEGLAICENDVDVDSLDSVVESCPLLREVEMEYVINYREYGGGPGSADSRIEQQSKAFKAFKARLRAKNSNVKVFTFARREGESESYSYSESEGESESESYSESEGE